MALYPLLCCSPYDRPSVTDYAGPSRQLTAGGGGCGGGGGGGGLAGSVTTPMPQAMGGLTGSDLGGTGLAGMGGAAGGGAAMGDTGYHGSSGVAGGAADYSGSRYGGGREAEETGLVGAGTSGFGHTTAGELAGGGRWWVWELVGWWAGGRTLPALGGLVYTLCPA